MKKRVTGVLTGILSLIVAFSAVLSFSVPCVSAKDSEKKSVELTISAAASLKEVMVEITALYKKENPDTTLTFNYGSSGTLQQQIEQGAPSDIFISAGKKQMDALKDEGLLVNDSIKNLLENRLVLVVNKDSKTKLTDFNGLSASNIKKIAMGEPKSVPAGQYGEQVLKYYKILDKLKSKIVYGKDVKEVLTWVETGNADAGLVYKTDAKTSTKVKVVATAPTTAHSPIIYPASIVKATKNLDEAKAFLKFLQKPQIINLFKKYDFEIPTTK